MVLMGCEISFSLPDINEEGKQARCRSEFLAISEEKTVDYGGYICAQFGFCLFGGAFSSDYIS